MGVKVFSVFDPVRFGPARRLAQTVTKIPPEQIAIERMRNLASPASSKSPDKKELNPPFKLDFSRIRSGKTEKKDPQYIHKLVAQSIHKWLWDEKESLMKVGVYNKEDEEYENINLFAVRKYEKDFKYLTREEEEKMKELLGIFKSEKHSVFKLSNNIFQSKFDKGRLKKSLFDRWLQYCSSSTLGISAGDAKDVDCEMKKIFFDALKLVNTEHNKKFEENEKEMFEIVSSKKINREKYITKCKEIIDKFKEMDSASQKVLKSEGIEIEKIEKYLDNLKEGKKGKKLTKLRFTKKGLSDKNIKEMYDFIDENYDKIEKIKKEQELLLAGVGIYPSKIVSSKDDSNGNIALQAIIKSNNPEDVKENNDYIEAKVKFDKESSLEDLKAMFYSKNNRPILISPTNKKLMKKRLDLYTDLAGRLSKKMSEDRQSRVFQCIGKKDSLNTKFDKLKSLAYDKLSYLPNSWNDIDSLIKEAENLRTEITRKQSTFSPNTTVSTKKVYNNRFHVATVYSEKVLPLPPKASSVYSTEDSSSESSENTSFEVDDICDKWNKSIEFRNLCEQLDSCLKRLDSKLKESSVENAFRVTAEQVTNSVKKQAGNLQRQSHGAVNKLNTDVERAINDVATGVGGGVRTVVGGVTSPFQCALKSLEGLEKIRSLRTPSLFPENPFQDIFKPSETSRQRKENEQEALFYLGQLHLHSGVPLPEGWGLRSNGSAYRKNIFGF